MNDPVTHLIPFSIHEMQMVANALAGFYRMCTNEKLNVDFSQTVALIKVLEKFKLHINGQDKTQLPDSLGVDPSGPDHFILDPAADSKCN